MKRVKACLNSNCQDYHKIYYKASDEYCLHCGTKLSFVCQHPKCFKQLPDDVQEKYCPVHIAERKDKKEKREETLTKVGTGILAGLTFAATCVKVGADIIRKK